MIYTVDEIPAATARDLIATHHYAGDAHPVLQRCFGLFLDGQICGAVTFGPPSDHYAARWADFELNRLALTHNRRNEASRLVGGALRLLGPVTVNSYADPSRDHDGGVYRATNFTYHGLSRASTRTRNGKWHRTGMKHRYSFGPGCPWPVVPFVRLTESQMRKAILNGYGGRRTAATVAERMKAYRARRLVDLRASCDQCGAAFKPSRSTAKFCGPRCRVAAHRVLRVL